MSYGYIVDSHCHLNYKGLVEDQSAVINRARTAGVGCMLAINTKISEYHEIVDIIDAHDDIFGTVGIHPHEAENEPNVALEALLKRTDHAKIVGIGETGLDYFYDNAPRAMQQDNFRTHIKAARETGLPVIIHTRDADDDCAAILQSEMGQGSFPGLIHCFTATPELAKIAINIGLYISVSGIVTFRSAKILQDTVKDLPVERILVETDAPFLAPVPHRGKTCEPAFVMDTARFIADLKGISFERLQEQTTDNFFRLFSKVTPPIKRAAA